MSVRVGKLGIVRLTGEDLTNLRRACFTRDGYRCQHEIAQSVSKDYEVTAIRCERYVTWESGHMAHIVGRGRGGSDVLDNVTTKCFRCHLELEHNPKSVPPKRGVKYAEPSQAGRGGR